MKRECWLGKKFTADLSAALDLLPRGAFSGEDAGNAGEVVRNADVGPGGGIEKRLDGGEGIVAEFEDENAAGLQVPGGLRDQVSVKFVAFFAAEKSNRGFVVADFSC
jgi:hypothetical protein